MTAVAFPSSLLPKIRRLQLTLDENKAQQRSQFTRRRQAVSLSGGTADMWTGVIEMALLTAPTDLRVMWAFLNKVGIYGLFTIADVDYPGPTSGATTGLVKGAGQSGMQLTVDGLATSSSILLEGEYFQVGFGFHILTADAISNPGGEVTFNFKPALRVSPADNATVIFNTPKMLLQMTSAASKDLDENKSGIFAISFEEALVTS